MNYFKGRVLILKGCHLRAWATLVSEPANSQNEESKQFRHGLCSPSTVKMELQQAVQIQLLLLRKERRDLHRLTSSAR